eukprot:gene14627-24535_t
MDAKRKPRYYVLTCANQLGAVSTTAVATAASSTPPPHAPQPPSSSPPPQSPSGGSKSGRIAAADVDVEVPGGAVAGSAAAAATVEAAGEPPMLLKYKSDISSSPDDSIDLEKHQLSFEIVPGGGSIEDLYYGLSVSFDDKTKGFICHFATEEAREDWCWALIRCGAFGKLPSGKSMKDTHAAPKTSQVLSKRWSKLGLDIHHTSLADQGHTVLDDDDADTIGGSNGAARNPKKGGGGSSAANDRDANHSTGGAATRPRPPTTTAAACSGLDLDSFVSTNIDARFGSKQISHRQSSRKSRRQQMASLMAAPSEDDGADGSGGVAATTTAKSGVAKEKEEEEKQQSVPATDNGAAIATATVPETKVRPVELQEQEDAGKSLLPSGNIVVAKVAAAASASSSSKLESPQYSDLVDDEESFLLRCRELIEHARVGDPELDLDDAGGAHEIYVVLNEYISADEDELALHQGEQLLVHRKDVDGWWLCSAIRRGDLGYAPATFLKPLVQVKEEHAEGDLQTQKGADGDQTVTSPKSSAPPNRNSVILPDFPDVDPISSSEWAAEEKEVLDDFEVEARDQKSRMDQKRMLAKQKKAGLARANSKQRHLSDTAA